MNRLTDAGLHQLSRIVALRVVPLFRPVPFLLVDDREFLVAISAKDYIPQVAVWTDSGTVVRSVKSFFEIAWKAAQEPSS